MKHNIHLEGYAYALRPVELEDAEFIIELRTPERTPFMHPITRTIEAQEAFLKQYFECQSDYYFVIQRKHDRNREGLAGLLDFNNTNHSAQFGRLVLRPGSFASAEAALLVLRLAFDTFCLNEVWGVTLADNLPMIAYVKSLGYEPQGCFKIRVGDKLQDAIRFVLKKDRWRTSEMKVTELAVRIANIVQSRR